jgi:hypothetical protein
MECAALYAKSKHMDIKNSLKVVKPGDALASGATATELSLAIWNDGRPTADW